MIDPERHWELMQGQASCMLASFSLPCLVGVLIWEVIWKTLWLRLVPLPQRMAGRIDESIKLSIGHGSGPAAS